MLFYSGIGRYVRNLIRNLVRIDNRNSYSLLLNRPDSLPDTGENLRLRTLKYRIPVYSVREQILLPFELGKTGPDLIHYPSFNMPLLGKRPFVATIHDLIYLYPQFAPGRGASLYARAMLNKAAVSSKKVITVSEFSKKEIIRLLGVKPEKIEVIYNGVDEVFFESPDAAADRQALKKFGIEGEYIFYAGNHQPRKNLSRLIQAFLKSGTKKFELVIAGKIDPRRAELYKIADSRAGKAVRFIGQVGEGELPALYRGASLFVFPSLFEGFGLPPLEAMACKTPVVASNRSSIPEVVGEAAMLVNPEDAGDIAKGMEKVLSSCSLASELRERGYERAKKFRWEDTASKTLKVFHEAIAN